MVSKYNTLVDDYNSLVKQYNEATNSTLSYYKYDDMCSITSLKYSLLLVCYKELLDGYYLYKDGTSTVKHIVTKDMIGLLLVVSVVINIVFGLILLGWI